MTIRTPDDEVRTPGWFDDEDDWRRVEHHPAGLTDVLAFGTIGVLMVLLSVALLARVCKEASA